MTTEATPAAADEKKTPAGKKKNEPKSTFSCLNTQLWDQIEEVDPKYTKAYTRGDFTGTSISHVHSRMAMTRVFGPAGLGWGFETQDWGSDDLNIICQGRLWYRPYYLDTSYPWELVCEVFEIGSIPKMMEDEKGNSKPTSDARKGAYTDALNRCVMALGHGARIYAGLDREDPPGPGATSAEENKQPGKTSTTLPPATNGKQPSASIEPSADQATKALIAKLVKENPLLRGIETQVVDGKIWFKAKNPTDSKKLKALTEYGFEPRGNGHLYWGYPAPQSAA